MAKKVFLVVLVVLAAILAAPVHAYDGVTGDTSAGASHQEHQIGHVAGEMPAAPPTEVSGPPETGPTSEVGTGGQEVTPRYQTREGHDEAARLVLARGCQIPKASAHPATPQVWHGTVAGRKRTEVFVRERGRARVLYAGSRLGATEVNNLVAVWAKKAGVASQSFVRKHVESRVAPLRRELGGLGQDVASIKGDINELQGRVANLEKAKPAPTTPPAKVAPTTHYPQPAEGILRRYWRENPWLVIAAICLTLALGGIAAIINRLNRGGNP